jgi:hypothetical protein
VLHLRVFAHDCDNPVMTQNSPADPDGPRARFTAIVQQAIKD